MLASTTAPPRRKTGMPCSVAAVLEALSPKEAAILRDWLGSPEWTARSIFEALLVEGHQVGLQTIGRHRRGECRCGR